MRINLFLILCFVFGTLVPGQSKSDELTLLVNGRTIELEGDILIEAQDKSLYFQATDGRIWLVTAEQIKRKVDVEEL